MAKDPAFLFYSQDFIVGVQTMNFEERGKYITILCQMHQQGRLSIESIKFLVGEISPSLKNKFIEDENNLFYNERLETESIKRKKFTESRRANALKSKGKKKSISTSKSTSLTSAKHMHDHMEDANENENEKEIKNGKKKIGEFFHVKLSEKELLKLYEEIGETQTDQEIKNLDEYIETSGKKYKNHSLVIKKWNSKRVKTETKGDVNDGIREWARQEGL